MAGNDAGDIGAGTGQVAAAFSDWSDLNVLAVEPSAAMPAQTRPTAAIQVLEGAASALPLPDASADAAWLSLVLHHLIRWFPETARAVETYPLVNDTCTAFAAAGFGQDALEQVGERWPISLADFLSQLDTFRQADTTMRQLSEEEFLRGKQRLRRAVRAAEGTANPEPRSNWLDLLVPR